MLIVDIDSLFKKYVAENLSSIKGKVTSDNIEETKEELYLSFQNHPFPELSGKTPSTFYEDEEDLVSVLKEHFEKNVPVSEYLIHELMHNGKEDDLIKLLTDDEPADLLFIVIEVLTHKNSKKCDNGLIDLLFSEKTSEEVKNVCVEYLLDEDVFDILISKIKECEKVNGAVCELLSRQKKRSQYIFDVLKREFINNKDKAPEYCGYLVEYGDEGFLETLYTAIEETNDYVSYKEIGLAIEALGGFFKNDRNFSKDKNYIKIKTSVKDERKTDN